MCVWSVDTCHKAHALSIFTTLGTAVLSSLHSGVVSVAKLTFYVSSPFWLWLTQLLLPSAQQGMDQPGLHCIQSISSLWIPGLYHFQGIRWSRHFSPDWQTDKRRKWQTAYRRSFQFTYRNVRYSYSQIGLLEEVDENLQSTFKNRRKPSIPLIIVTETCNPGAFSVSIDWS